MTRRHTDTGKWSDSWFRKLPPLHKLAWLYLCDTCDIAGIADLDGELANFQIGGDIDWVSFVENCHGRVLQLPTGEVFIPGFIKFQQQTEELNPENNCHVGIIRRLDRRGLKETYFQGVSQGPTKPLQSPCQGAKVTLARVTSKSKSKSKSKSNLLEGVQGETEENSAATSAFDEFWEAYPLRGGKRIGKKEARDRFRRLAPASWPDLLTATKHYDEFCRVTDRPPKDPARFLANDVWRDFVEANDHAAMLASKNGREPLRIPDDF